MIDLNVVLDVVQRREPHFGASAEVLAMAVRGDIEGLLPAHALPTLAYIIARHAGRATAERTVDWLLGKLRVAPAEHAHFLRARGLCMNDFEDAVVVACAEAARCDCVVTRNIADFADAPVPGIMPEELLAERSWTQDKSDARNQGERQDDP